MVSSLASSVTIPVSNVGAFHGRVYWEHLVLPLDEGFREVISRCMATSKTSAAVLCSRDASSVAALHQQIEALLQARYCCQHAIILSLCNNVMHDNSDCFVL